MEFVESRILEREWLNGKYYRLRLEKPRGFSYHPGQFIAVRRGDEKRYYSLASHPEEECLELIIKKVDGGKFSTWLSEEEIGRRIEISRALGKMRPEGRRVAMIANGSGIVPFVSFIKHFSRLVEGGKEIRAMLVYGERTTGDIIFRDWFSSIPWLEFVPVTSREGKRKHVQDLFDRVAEFGPEKVYAVGSLSMALDARKFFREAGMDVEAEGFG